MHIGGPGAGSEPHERHGRPALSSSDQARVEAYATEIREKWSNDKDEDEHLDDVEKQAIAAFQQALGKKAVHGGEPPHPSSQSISELRTSPIKIRVAPMKDREGKVIASNYVELVDSYSERMESLKRKVAEGTLTRAETAEIQGGSKYLFKVNDVRTSVMDVSIAAYMANLHVRLIANANIIKAQVLTQTMTSLGSHDLAADRAVVRKNLTRQRRAEALAASTIGLVAAYEAVINEGRNPKAIDVIAESGLKAFPLKAEATEEEAAAYLEAWRTAPPRTRQAYEGTLRKRYGDAEYDKSYKAGVEQMFAGAPVPPEAATARDRAAAATETASAIAHKDASGALDAAAKAFPGDGTVRASLEGAAALTRGDTKGAIQAALGLIPGGGLVKDGLGLAAKLLFPG